MPDILSLPQEGQSVSAGWLAALYALCRRNRVTVAAGSGLTAREGPDGTALALDNSSQGFGYMKLSTLLKAGDGATQLGYGTGKIMAFTAGTSGSNGSLAVPPNATDEDVYNLFTTAFSAGSTILVERLDDAWHFVNTLCKNAVN